MLSSNLTTNFFFHTCTNLDSPCSLFSKFTKVDLQAQTLLTSSLQTFMILICAHTHARSKCPTDIKSKYWSVNVKHRLTTAEYFASVCTYPSHSSSCSYHTQWLQERKRNECTVCLNETKEEKLQALNVQVYSCTRLLF